MAKHASFIRSIDIEDDHLIIRAGNLDELLKSGRPSFKIYTYDLNGSNLNETAAQLRADLVRSDDDICSMGELDAKI